MPGRLSPQKRDGSRMRPKVRLGVKSERRFAPLIDYAVYDG